MIRFSSICSVWRPLVLGGLAFIAAMIFCSCQSGPPVYADVDAFEKAQQETQPPVRAVPDAGEGEYLRQGWTGNGYHNQYRGGYYDPSLGGGVRY